MSAASTTGAVALEDIVAALAETTGMAIIAARPRINTVLI
jgi:hypothetical protein